MFLKISQKSELGDAIRRYGLSPSDFSLREDIDHNAITFTYKNNYSYFDISLTPSLQFAVEFAPSASTTKRSNYARLGWNEVLNMFDDWVGYISADLNAEDPWADVPTAEEFEEAPDTLFTTPELKTIDAAIDASFEKLVAEANSNGLEKKMDDVIAEISELKKLARKTPRAKWLEIFKEVIAAKLIEWGLDVLIGSEVLKVLFEMAKPVLKIVAGVQ